MAEINTIKKHRNIVRSNKGWSKELNLISWNEREPKYDIRDWALSTRKWAKVTLSKDELVKLRDILNDMEL